jgi:2-oxo-4-hydroxy-4-carboxy-5-ureidoimidazoline decarboxylase
MKENEFIARYGGIYEHSPWVAERAAALLGDSADIDVIARVMADCVDNASLSWQLALIRAHPDLVGKAAIEGELTRDSETEQASAGLDRCSPEEYARFKALNEEYRRKFGFPFVMAVRNKSRSEILEAFESRVENDYDEEFENALLEIHRIARMRLIALGAN